MKKRQVLVIKYILATLFMAFSFLRLHYAIIDFATPPEAQYDNLATVHSHMHSPQR